VRVDLLPVQHLLTFALTEQTVLLVQFEKEFVTATVHYLHRLLTEGQPVVGAKEDLLLFSVLLTSVGVCYVLLFLHFEIRV